MVSPRPPESVLAAVPLWRRTHSVRCRPLGGGQSNRNWLVEADGERSVLRLDAGRVPAPVVDHERERIVLQAAAAQGIAPELLHADPATGVLVTRYLPGTVLNRDHLRDPAILRELGRLLRRVHALPDPGRGYALVDAGEIYLAAIRGEARRTTGRRLVNELRSLGLEPKRGKALCHMDPVAGNVLRVRGRLMLIDWEFAVAGDPLFDLAAVIAYHEPGPPAVAALLEGYRFDTVADPTRLQQFVRAYDALHWLWLMASGEALTVERQRLERRLGLAG